MPRPITSTGSAVWNGDLSSGNGSTSLETSQLGTFPVNWKARAEESEQGTTSPEELIGASLATCYSMQFSNMLAENDTPAEKLETSADVVFNIAEGGITGITLTVKATIPGIEDADFQRLAAEAKDTCPVSKALSAVDISLDSSLA